MLKMAEHMSGVGHWLVTPATGYIYWSDEVYRIHGVTKEEHTPDLESGIHFYHPDDRPKVKEAVERAFRSGEDFLFEARICRPDGEIRYVTSSGKCFSENGETVSLFGVFRDVTEDRIIRNEAVKAAQCLETLINSTYDGYWDWHINDNYEYMSPRFWEILGFDPAEKQHSPDEWMDLMHPEDLKSALQNYEMHAETKGAHPYDQEVRYTHKDGSTVYIICRGAIVEHDENGAPVRMVGTHTDITPLKKAQLAAQEAMERFDLAAKGANAGIWDWNIKTDELFWSDRFKEMLGITEKDFEPHFDTFLSALHPEDEARVKAKLEAHLETGEPYDVKYRLKRKDGAYIHIHARGQSIICPKTGKAARMAGSVEDITDIYLLQEKERVQRVLLEEIFSAHPDALFVKDEEFRIVKANAAFLHFYPEEQRNGVIGTTTFERYDEAEKEAFFVQDKIAFAEGESSVYETIHFPNGERIVLFTRKIRFTGDNGRPHILGIARDVTEKEDLLEELKRSNEELDNFAYICAHDLKEPLRGMSNHARFLAEDFPETLGEEGAKRVERIMKLAGRADIMVSELLHFSRAGSTQGAYAEVNFADLARNAADAIIPEREDVLFTIDASAEKNIYCDSVRITEVIYNLIVNAIKYNDKAQKTVTVSASGRVTGGVTETVFCVADNGIGIEEKHKDDIFRIFRRLHKKDEYGGGTGAGLSIVKRIIETHGGRIWLNSCKGQGTTFFFTLEKA